MPPAIHQPVPDGEPASIRGRCPHAPIPTSDDGRPPVNLGPMEIGLIVLAVLLLFGYKKLPDASRSLGWSLRTSRAR
jgi:mttA/Hcf106 family